MTRGAEPEQTVVDVGRGIELCYEQVGDPNGPPIVLVAGFGSTTARLLAH